MKSTRHPVTPARMERIKEVLRTALAARTEILFAYLFGSCLEGDHCGDLDLAVYVRPDTVPESAFDYEAELAGELEPSIGLPVDVVLLNGAAPPLRYHASCGELLLSRDEPARYGFLERTWRDYFDYQHYRRRFLLDVLEA